MILCGPRDYPFGIITPAATIVTPGKHGATCGRRGRQREFHAPVHALAAPVAVDLVMKQCYKTTRRVEFRDTDASGMAHFSIFYIYMEQAEHELLRHLGLSVMLSDEQGLISFPRVATRCEYQRAVKFEDLLDIEVAVVRLGNKSVTYEFSFSHEGRPVASGQITSVCCRFNHDGTPRAIPIPPWIAQKLALASVA